MTDRYANGVYEAIHESAPIRQGDIFHDVPRVDMSLSDMPVYVPGAEPKVSSWDHERSQPGLKIIAQVTPVWGIVATQDCDCQWSASITLCQIDPLEEVVRDFREVKDDRNFVRKLHRQSIDNLKWLYLPPSSVVGFESRMAVDFRECVRVPTEDLLHLRHLRPARLGKVAFQHFRERLAHFFRRYPVNEWYPLNKSEFEAYKEGAGEVRPYPWQE